MNHSPHTYKVFRHEPGKPGEINITRNVRWEHWDHPHKSKLTDSSPLFTKVEGLNKVQKALLEKAIDKFIINNKMCYRILYCQKHQRIPPIQIKGGKLMITSAKPDTNSRRIHDHHYIQQ
jgi:hypothetical protein